MTNRRALLPEALRLRREEKLSLDEISEKLSLAKSTLSLWLKDYPLPKEEMQRRAAERLGVKMERSEAPSRIGCHAAGIHPNQIGEISELAVQLALREKGFDVWLPSSPTLKSDLLLEEKGCFYRVQIKTGKLKNGTIRFNTISYTTGESYSGHCEFIAVFVPELRNVYMVPVPHVQGMSHAHLRIDPLGALVTSVLASNYLLVEGWEAASALASKKVHVPPPISRR